MATDTTLSLGPMQSASDMNEEKIHRPTLGWTILHLRRSAHRFSRGLRKRVCALSDEWIAAPLEEASWKLAEKVEKVGQRLFQRLDCKIEELTRKRKKPIEDEIELGRFDDEGGAMVATQCYPKRKPKQASSIQKSGPQNNPEATRH
jgi:hypothetical protein